MKKQVEFLQKDPTRKYNTADFVRLKLIPWARHQKTVKKIIELDKKGPNVLHAKITGVDNKRRYLVSGEYIINYLQIYGPILIGTVRKPKQIYGRKNRNQRG